MKHFVWNPFFCGSIKAPVENSFCEEPPCLTPNLSGCLLDESIVCCCCCCCFGFSLSPLSGPARGCAAGNGHCSRRRRCADHSALGFHKDEAFSNTHLF
jgi:hypothetical protein